MPAEFDLAGILLNLESTSVGWLELGRNHETELFFDLCRAKLATIGQIVPGQIWKQPQDLAQSNGQLPESLPSI